MLSVLIRHIAPRRPAMEIKQINRFENEISLKKWEIGILWNKDICTLVLNGMIWKNLMQMPNELVYKIVICIYHMLMETLGINGIWID